MKNIFILVFAIWATDTFGQSPINKINGLIIKSNNGLENDTSFKVVYAREESNINKPAYFLNGKFVSETLLVTLNPMLIEDINIVKDKIQVDSITYYGQVQIKTKNNYNPKIISLQELKEKYTNLKSKPAIFMIDGVIINAEYGNYFVDQNFILTIIIDKVENTKENINLGLIKLLTKSEANIVNSKKIMIRGTEMAMTK